MARVFVSIGSNVEREKYVRLAVAQLKSRFGSLTLSPVYESEAVGFEGAKFYNLVLAFDTDLSVVALAAMLRAIEDQHGRRRVVDRFVSRNIDLDLLLYDDLVCDEGGVSLPRDEIAFYAFVLCPLADIAADCHHPVTGETYAEMWANFDQATQPLWQVDFDCLAGIDAA